MEAWTRTGERGRETAVEAKESGKRSWKIWNDSCKGAPVRASPKGMRILQFFAIAEVFTITQQQSIHSNCLPKAAIKMRLCDIERRIMKISRCSCRLSLLGGVAWKFSIASACVLGSFETKSERWGNKQNYTLKDIITYSSWGYINVKSNDFPNISSSCCLLVFWGLRTSQTCSASLGLLIW